MDRQREMSKSGSGYSKPATCRYINQLEFLRDAISNRPTHSNIPVSRHVEISPPPSPAPFSPAVYSTPQAPPAEKIPLATIVPNKKKKKVEIDQLEDFLIKSIKDKQGEKQVDDEEDLFCKSIAHTLRRLDTKSKQLAKIKIQQLLFELEFKEGL